MHKFVTKCRHCKSAMTIVDLYFTTGTEMVFWVICVKCNMDEERRYDFLDIQSDLRRKNGITIIDGNATVN